MPNNIMKLFQILFLFLFITKPLLSQNLKDNFVQLSIEDGLPSTIVLDLLQDRYGYVWIGTINGLARYDGYVFKHYNPDIEIDNSLPINIIVSIFEDKQGDLWIGGQGGLCKYIRENDQFLFYSLSDFQSDTSQSVLSVTSISEDNDGILWLGVGTHNFSPTNDGVFFLDKETNQIKQYEFSDSTHTLNILDTHVSQNGEVWFSGYRGLFRLNKELRTVNLYKPENMVEDFGVICVNEDIKGILWLGTHNEGLYSFNPVDNSFNKFHVSPVVDIGDDFNILDMVIEDDDNIWLATNRTLIHFNPETRKVHHFLPGNNNSASISSVDNRCIIQDFAGSIWIGSWGKGLNRYDQAGTDFQTFIHDSDDPDSYGPGWAIFFEEDHKNNIWIGTGQKFINRFNRKEKNFSKVPASENEYLDDQISAIYKDRNDNIWVGSSGYLYNLNKDYSGFTSVPVMQKYGRNVINEFYEDVDGNLWFGRHDGLFSYNKNNKHVSHFTFNSLPGAGGESNWVYRFASDNNQNLWIGTNIGLFKYDLKTERISRIGFNEDKSKSFSDHDINSLYLDQNGILWVGTWFGGLNRYDPKTEEIKTFTKKAGLATNSIQGIIGDEENDALWLSTFAGISRFDLKKEEFLNFNINDGVHSNQFSDGSVLKTSQGEFLFGGADGFTMFKPEDIKENIVAPRVFLTDFKLSNESLVPGPDTPLRKPVYEASEIILEHHENDISFDFLAIHFINAHHNKYAYMLENYENEWRHVKQQNTATWQLHL